MKTIMIWGSFLFWFTHEKCPGWRLWHYHMFSTTYNQSTLQKFSFFFISNSISIGFVYTSLDSIYEFKNLNKQNWSYASNQVSSLAGNMAIPYSQELLSVNVYWGSKSDTPWSSALTWKESLGSKNMETQLSGLRFSAFVRWSFFRAWRRRKFLWSVW